MKVAIMQPYVFPYIGYFQLIDAVDIFVFYDDVNFIKKGFINRNYLLLNKKKTLFTIPCKGASQNKNINQIKLDLDNNCFKKLVLSLEQSYKNASNFKAIFPLISDFLLTNKCTTISELAIESVKLVSNYLELDTKFINSSLIFNDTIHLGREERLIKIANKLKASNYINSIGGLELYKKRNFSKYGIYLQFLKSNAMSYEQFNIEFVPWLSIIDVLMFNSKTEALRLLKNYEFV
jgi:hypothetical protein